jgi:hypothetical protein
VHLSGLTFDGNAKKGEAVKQTRPMLALFGSHVSLMHCHVKNTSMAGIVADRVSGSITACRFSDCSGPAISASDVKGLVIDQCIFERCGFCTQGGCEGAANRRRSSIVIDGDGIRVTGNYISECFAGISLAGNGVVSGNVISKAQDASVRLGAAGGTGQILCQSNLIRDCRIGIAVASSGDDIMASLNMITGAKDGAIRAFDGDRLVGPDLARQSAEAYLNLMVAGNVVR